MCTPHGRASSNHLVYASMSTWPEFGAPTEYTMYNERRVNLVDAERRFRRSCEQIVMLNRALTSLQKRYDNAKRRNVRSFRYHLRLRLAVIEGMRNVYYDYAHEKAKQVAELRRELFGEIVEIVSEESWAKEVSAKSQRNPGVTNGT